MANDLYQEDAMLSEATNSSRCGYFLCFAGRISYVFGLSGPCLAIDTACSSGLVAIANAHNALMLGAVPAALAGGVNLLLSPGTHAMYAVAGELAS